MRVSGTFSWRNSGEACVARQHVCLGTCCEANDRISGNRCKIIDTFFAHPGGALSFQSNDFCSKHLLETQCTQSNSAKLRELSFALGSNELLCSIQQVNKWVIAPGLLAHQSRKAGAPASKMYMTPQSSNIHPCHDHQLVILGIQYSQHELAEFSMSHVLASTEECSFHSSNHVPEERK